MRWCVEEEVVTRGNGFTGLSRREREMRTLIERFHVGEVKGRGFCMRC